MGQRRKHVTQNAVTQDVQPPDDNQHIVRALGSRGGNIVEVQYPDGSTTLCMMPAKFNRKLWVRRGGFLIIESSQEAEQDSSSRVTGTICAVLYDEHIKQLKKMPGVWPPEFAAAQQLPAEEALDLPSPHSSDSEADEGDGTAAAAQQTPADGGTGGSVPAGGLSTSTQQAQVQATAAAVDAATAAECDGNEDQEEGSDDDLPPLQQINNRRVIHHYLSDSDSGSDES